jgi:hypothetical protein
MLLGVEVLLETLVIHGEFVLEAQLEQLLLAEQGHIQRVLEILTVYRGTIE